MKREQLAKFTGRVAVITQEIYGELVAIGAIEYPAAVSMGLYGSQLVAGGETLDGDLTIEILKTTLPELPKNGTTVLARGEKWIVKKSGAAKLETVWHLHCEPYN